MRRTVLTLAAWALLGVPGVFGALSGPQPGPKNTQGYAIVNVSFLVENYQKVPDMQRRLDAQFQPKEKELELRNKDLDERARSLGEEAEPGRGLPQTEPVFNEVQRLNRDQFKYKQDLTQLNAKMQEMMAKEMQSVLTDIRIAIKAIAERDGYPLVFRSADTDDPAVIDDPARLKDPAVAEKKTELEKTAPKTSFEILERFHRNPVLYGAKDITQEVLTYLNTDYAKRSLPAK